MLDPSDLITDPDFTHPGGITLRRANRTLADGTSRETSTDQNIVAVVQPASQFELKAMPEGTRLDNVIAVYSLVEIRCTPQAQDIVLVDGVLYRAVKSEPWSGSGYFLTFCEGYQP